jgi:hypothetical protein
VQSRSRLGTKKRRCEKLVRTWDLDPRARQVNDGPGVDDEPGHRVPRMGLVELPGSQAHAHSWPERRASQETVTCRGGRASEPRPRSRDAVPLVGAGRIRWRRWIFAGSLAGSLVRFSNGAIARSSVAGSGATSPSGPDPRPPGRSTRKHPADASESSPGGVVMCPADPRVPAAQRGERRLGPVHRSADPRPGYRPIGSTHWRGSDSTGCRAHSAMSESMGQSTRSPGRSSS